MTRRPKLAPLEPNAFLRWANHNYGAPFSTAITVEDNYFELGAQYQPSPGDPEDFREFYPLEQLRREYVSLAARVRRNQRLGLDPWATFERRISLQGSQAERRRAHNPETAGSTPAPATTSPPVEP